MGFWQKVGSGLGSIAGGIIGGPAGMAIGGMAGGSLENVFGGGDKSSWQDMITGGIDSVAGLMSQGFSRKEAIELMEKQNQLQLERQRQLMGEQHEYNEKSADAAHARQLDYWNSTNFEAQRKHLESAGMSIGLMYGMGGQGGSTGAAPMGSVSQGAAPNASNIGAGIGLGLQSYKAGAEMRLLESQADKNEAEADKTKGADTKLAESQTDLNEKMQSLISAQEQLTAANYFVALQTQSKVFEEAEKLALENKVNKATVETQIALVEQQYTMNTVSIIEKLAGVKLKESQVEYIGKQIEYYAYDALTRRISADASMKSADALTERVINELNLGNRKLDQEQERILKDWIYGGIESFVKIGNLATDVVKLFKKPLQNMTEEVIKQMFDKKGRPTSSSTTSTTRTMH